MSAMALWLRIAAMVAVAAYIALLARLLHQRLYRRYRWLFWLFAAIAAREIALLQIPFRRALYGSVYMLSAPVVWVLAILAILELYRLLFDDFPGLASAARVFTGISATVGISVALGLYILGPGPPARAALAYRTVIGVDQTVHLATFLFLALMQVFLMRFPVPHRPNLTVCTIGYTLYFGSGAGVMLLMAAAPAGRTWRYLELSLLFFSNLVLLVWAASMRRSGEQVQVEKRAWAPGEPEALRDQLETFGGLIERAGRIFHKKID
jgi:hypothetical protein